MIINKFDVERYAKLSDELSEKDAEDTPSAVLRHAVKSQIETLEDQRYEETKQNFEETKENIQETSDSADTESVEEAQADLANRFFGGKSGYDKHSATGPTEKVRPEDDVEEEQLSDEASMKQKELSERFF